MTTVRWKKSCLSKVNERKQTALRVKTVLFSAFSFWVYVCAVHEVLVSFCLLVIINHKTVHHFPFTLWFFLAGHSAKMNWIFVRLPFWKYGELTSQHMETIVSMFFFHSLLFFICGWLTRLIHFRICISLFFPFV